MQIIRIYVLTFSILYIASCNNSDQSNLSLVRSSITPKADITTVSDPQISEYIRNIHQDKGGNLWLGTNGDGVAYYNGDSISYFANSEGFHGQQITGITEDLDQNIWFATKVL